MSRRAAVGRVFDSQDPGAALSAMRNLNDKEVGPVTQRWLFYTYQLSPKLNLNIDYLRARVTVRDNARQSCVR